MPSGTLVAAYAYEVAPQQGSGFVGGVIAVTPQLQAALDHVFDRSKIDDAPSVTFLVDQASKARSHAIRDAVMAVAFTSATDEPAALDLAARLGSAMDHRSKATLLMVTVHASTAASKRRALLWTFPQQEVFSLTSSGKGARLELLEAFNRESHLRKVAMLEGPNTKSGMLTAKVLDFQAAAAERSVADLWITRFLDARLQMSDTEGTQLLARALRAAHNKTRDDQASQDQILAAITGLRVSANPRQSLDQVAKTYLTGKAADAFLAAAGPEVRAAVFTLDRQRFDDLVQYKRFTLDNGVVVSAPFAELRADGGAVEVTDVDGQRRLRVEGVVEEEQVRTRA